MNLVSKAVTRSILALSLLLMAACAGQMAVPQTPAQQAAYVEATLTGFANTAATLRPHLSEEAFQKLRQDLNNARVALDLIKVAVKSNSNTSVDMLRSIQSLLNAIALELTKLQQEVPK